MSLTNDQITTTKGKPCFIHNGNSYRNGYKLKNGNIVWRCLHQNCPAQVTTIDSPHIFISSKNNHSHPPNLSNINKRKFDTSIKMKATTTNDNPRSIIASTLIEFSHIEFLNLPRERSLLKNVQEARRYGNYRTLPQSAAELIIPRELSTTSHNENFIVFDSNEIINSRIILFGSPTTISYMHGSSSIYFDATFKTVPSLFYQLFTIHGEYNGYIFLVFYALMQKKDQNEYSRIWNYLAYNYDFYFTNSLSDFERAAINAFQATFPNTTHSCCFFHFAQCIWRKVQNYGLETQYIENSSNVCLLLLSVV
ncbi:hypothetical protein RF11_13829 [Thelohanellus kitauei]|uniref:MULE transposase domain-containing protein n=1 Tax=Thelohanellus kitauei TaxID=669202 RepID=A0A0C2IAQ2_THEKT|nr:hypothetical protein RF11_13829 [Thelohanellus kitauei]